MNERQWKLLVHKLYQENLNLPVQLVLRYPGNDTIARELSNLIQQNSIDFTSCVPAVLVSH